MFDLAHLPNGAPNEKAVVLLRRHWFTMLSLALSFAFVLLLPPAIYIGLLLIVPDFFSDSVRVTLLVLGGSIFFLFAWLFLYQSYIDYYLDVWIVTNRRILSMEQHGLFSRTVSELRLHRVQDVTAEVHGFWRTMFDFGDLYIQTAGEKERFIFEEIPHPNAVAKTILDLAEEQRKAHLEEAVEEFGMPDGKKQAASST
ncbi:PH domain-containing protein [Candidatus Uhrbacteria bacterium]|nr:PH domain-containing protein [Candidatus Uhrbacteria bacterium]